MDIVDGRRMHEIYTLSFLAAQQQHRYHQPKTKSSSKWGLSLGSLHLTLGLLGVIFGIVGLLSEYHANKYGSSLWCGLIFELTGAFGVWASKNWYSRKYLKCFCLASVVSIFTAIILLSLTCVGIANHYVHFDATIHVSVANYMANVSANIIVLSLLEIAVCLVSITASVKAMHWRYRPPPPLSQPVVIRETFMSPSTDCDVGEPVADSQRHHQYVTVPDVLLQGVMPSVFGTTRNNSRLTFANPQLLNAVNLMGLDETNELRYLTSPIKTQNVSSFSENFQDKITYSFPMTLSQNRNY